MGNIKDYERIDDEDNTPIGAVCKKYDLPHLIGNLFHNKSNEIIVDRIKVFSEWAEKWINGKMEFQKHVGNVGYGYKYDFRNMIVPVPEEQIVISLIMQLRKEGKTHLQIAGELNNRRIKPKYTDKWSQGQVRGIYWRNK